jgi:hypothetical protein
MNAERKKEYRKLMSAYQIGKMLEYQRKRYAALSPEKKAEKIAKVKARYEENKERLREYQKARYHRIKGEKNFSSSVF